MDDLIFDLPCIRELDKLVKQYGPLKSGADVADINNVKRPEKVVICKFWMRGLCVNGEECPFLHEMDANKMVCQLCSLLNNNNLYLFLFHLLLYGLFPL